jgi:hypothetical protein
MAIPGVESDLINELFQVLRHGAHHTTEVFFPDQILMSRLSSGRSVVTAPGLHVRSTSERCAIRITSTTRSTSSGSSSVRQTPRRADDRPPAPRGSG